MVKCRYQEPKNIRPANRQLLEKIIKVVEAYKKQGYRMTLRQLFYQLVSKSIIPNTQSQYKKIGGMLTDARLCGQVDWDIIEDRVRAFRMHNEWSDIRSLVDAAVDNYRKNRHAGQQNYVEVWVEKDALSSILEPITKNITYALW